MPTIKEPTKLCKGSDIKTARPGDKLRFGGGLYLLVSPAGAKSWQVHYHVAGKHQATIVGRWPDLGIDEAKAKRAEIKATVRDGGDPALERRERRTERQEADAATVRVVAERWLKVAPEARNWSADYTHHTKLRLANHVLPVIGNRPIGRITTHEIEELILGLLKPTADRKGLRSQAVHVRQMLQVMFDYALRRKLITENPVRVIAEDLPKRVRGDEREISRAHVATIADARTILAAVEAGASPFIALAHRLIALTGVRKLEGVEAEWSEIAEGPDGMTWTIPAARMKGRRGKKREHVVPLSPQAADVFRAAKALATALGLATDAVFPGEGGAKPVSRSSLNRVYASAGIVGRHSIHGWRSTFYTVMKERDYRDEITIDAMLAHRIAGPSQAARHYDHSRLIRNGVELRELADRRRVACAWADALLAGAPSAFAVAGLVEPSNVVRLREAA